MTSCWGTAVIFGILVDPLGKGNSRTAQGQIKYPESVVSVVCPNCARFIKITYKLSKDTKTWPQQSQPRISPSQATTLGLLKCQPEPLEVSKGDKRQASQSEDTPRQG